MTKPVDEPLPDPDELLLLLLDELVLVETAALPPPDSAVPTRV